MFSKFLFLIFVCGFLFSACGLKTGEPASQTEVAEISSTKCLSKSIKDLKSFFAGDTTDDQVEESFACVSKVLISFKNNVRGSSGESYTPEELVYFIEKNFLKDEHKFSAEFISEIMELKVVLIGGPKDLFYKSEIDQLSKLVSRLQPEVIKVNRHMKILTTKWDYTGLTDEQKEKRFLEAKKATSDFFVILAGEFARTGNSYSTERLIAFIKQVALFAKAEQSALDKIDKAGPFLIAFKKNLIGESTAIASQDWSKITASVHEMLYQVLRIDYFLNPLGPQDDEKKWIVYKDITMDLTELLSSLLRTQKKSELTNQQIHEVVSSLLPVFTEKTLSEELVADLTQLKVALLGADQSSKLFWTAQDFQMLRTKVPTLFMQIQKVVFVLDRVLHKENLDQVSYEEFNQLEKKFVEAADQIALNFDGSYSFASLKDLLLNVEKSKLIQNFELPENLDELMSAAVSAKSMLTGNPGAELATIDLRALITVASRGYFHYLEYSRFIEPFEIRSAQFAKPTDRLVVKVEASVQKVLSDKKTHLITTDEIVDLFETLKSTKLIVIEISGESLRAIAKVLWENVLVTPERRLNGLALPGFNLEALTNLVYEGRLFLAAHGFITDAFAAQNTWSQLTLIEQIDQFLSRTSDPYVQTALTDLRRVIWGPVNLSFNELGYLAIADDQFKKLNYDDLMLSHLGQLASRVAIRSFALESERVTNLTGVTLAEAQTAFDKLATLVHELDLVDPENTKFISSRYRETNLFVAHSNGDQYANFEELHDIVLHIVSGLERSDKVQVEAVKICLPSQAEPVTRFTPISEDCLLEHYLNSNAGFESMPGFLMMKNGEYTHEQLKKYYMSLLKAAGHVPNDKKEVYFGDADLFPHVVQYVEMLFAVYDTSHDGILIKDEALRAFPVFKLTIKEMLTTFPNGNKIPDSQLPGVYMYLLKYGKKPQGLQETLKFLGFIADESQWIVNSSRLDIGTIFNFIADSLNKPTPITTGLAPVLTKN